ncbi:MAG: PAS domain-containing methyl-accepting chemotaxis protein [Hyphomonadaceae bacterium]
MIQAIDKVMATIAFTPSGEILTANQNFLAAMGYSLDEIVGRHHRQFCDPAYVNSPAYREFWNSLAAGKFVSGEFKRLAKNGREVWLQASYNPIIDATGRVVRVVKFATDITETKHKAMDAQGQLEAINRSQAVIEFGLDGTILNANDNFCRTMGYALGEIRGKHHRMFVERAYADSREYTEFWNKLRSGEFQTAEYKRIGKGGREIWIQASYNPIKDPDGNPIKVVKYATDITEMTKRRLENERLSVEIEGDLSEIAGNVASVSSQATEVASSATEAASTLQSVAAAAEELNASIREISSNVSNSRRSADKALTLTQDADTATKALSTTSQQMTGIVELIDDIASQINLLALNATIESARAGEAGRGFAVVASEIKQLAAQVSNATKTISTEIAGVQTVSGNVVSALKSIESSVEEISESVSSVVAAVEQQSSATGEISHTMQTASDAVGTIDRNVNLMATAMSNTAESTTRVRENMRSLVR